MCQSPSSKPEFSRMAHVYDIAFALEQLSKDRASPVWDVSNVAATGPMHRKDYYLSSL